MTNDLFFPLDSLGNDILLFALDRLEEATSDENQSHRSHAGNT